MTDPTIPPAIERHSHILTRTSPIGEKFVGRCSLCGKEGLTRADLWGCEHPLDEASEDDRVLKAILGDDAP